MKMYTLVISYETGRKEYIPMKAKTDKAARKEASEFAANSNTDDALVFVEFSRERDGLVAYVNPDGVGPVGVAYA